MTFEHFVFVCFVAQAEKLVKTIKEHLEEQPLEEQAPQQQQATEQQRDGQDSVNSETDGVRSGDHTEVRPVEVLLDIYQPSNTDFSKQSVLNAN